MLRSLCPHCKRRLDQGQRIHPECIAGYADAREEKAKRTEAKKMKNERARERAEIRERKAALKRIPDLINDAKKICHEYIRERDKGLPCISCGKPPPDASDYHGGRDAGHYRSVGSASHLRFHEDNIHGQCVHCNQWKAGNAVDYRIRLLERIGSERVIALEENNAIHKWQKSELIEIAATYRMKLKELKARTE